MSVLLRATDVDVHLRITPRGLGYRSSRHKWGKVNYLGSLPALHKSVSDGNLEQAQHLLATGSLVNHQHSFGITPLHLAVNCPCGPAMTGLLFQQDDINVQDQYGDTPLHYAARDEEAAVQLVQFLEQRGLRTNARNHLSMTALHYAAQSKCLKNVALLLGDDDSSFLRRREPLDPNLHDSEGNTALHQAVESNYPEMVDLLLHCPTVEPDCTNMSGKTPEALAEHLAYEEVIKVFNMFKEYDMSLGPQRALIINNEEFKHLQRRDGSGEDATELEEQFRARGFIVKKNENRTAEQIFQDILEFRRVCSENPTSAMIVCIMTHGRGALMCGTDSKAGSREVSMTRILGMLARVHAPELAGIPKVVLLHSCRDPPLDTIVRQVSDGTVPEYGEAGFHTSRVEGIPLSVAECISSSPPDEDFLVVFPALDNRSCPIGYFEPALARKLNANRGPVDWLHLLRDVNRRYSHWACAEIKCPMKKSLWM